LPITEYKVFCLLALEAEKEFKGALRLLIDESGSVISDHAG
jgi:hypothetical protein